MVRIIQNYTLYQVIGEGAYGKVYRAVNKLDNKQYAVKVIQVKKFQTNKKLQQCTVHEINILTNIEKNKHIITYFDMLKTQNNFYFVYEYCNGGTLQGILRKQQNIEQKKALLILKQLLQAFQVLNKYNIMHRDLKPDNIFFHNGVLKVGDFGFCKSLQKAEMTKTMLGSPIYMAPEILNGQIYSNKADIWSIGVVLYEMLYGFCPFESNSIPKLIEVLKQTQLQFPTDVPVSNQTKTLLRKILTKDPQKRIEWMQLFQLKISNEGKLVQDGPKLSLVDQNNSLMKTVRQINETDQTFSPTGNFNRNFASSGGPMGGISKANSINANNGSTNSSNSNTSTGSTNNNLGMFSPRNMGGINDSINRGSIQQKPKITLLKKPVGTVQQGQTTSATSIRKTASNGSSGGGNLKQKSLKFHQEIVRGLNISRSMGLNNEKLTPLFSYFMLKHVSQKMKSFREQNFNPQGLTMQGKQLKQVFDQQIDELQYEMALMRNKVQDFADWKKAVKAKINDFKNIRLLYEMTMFMSDEAASQNISHNDMKSMIRIKSG